ncbi:hypothetical protein Tco_1337130 [Tanacetum coccineum]
MNEGEFVSGGAGVILVGGGRGAIYRTGLAIHRAVRWVVGVGGVGWVGMGGEDIGGGEGIFFSSVVGDRVERSVCRDIYYRERIWVDARLESEGCVCRLEGRGREVEVGGRAVACGGVSKGNGLLGPNGGSGRKFKGGLCGNVGSCGSNGGRGEDGGVENKGSVGSKFMDNGEECLDGWVGAGGGEVKGGGVDFGVSRILLGEIPREIMGKWW